MTAYFLPLHAHSEGQRRFRLSSLLAGEAKFELSIHKMGSRNRMQGFHPLKEICLTRNDIAARQFIDSNCCVGVRVVGAARANWKGFIKLGEVAVAVALYTAASSSERIAFNTVNRATGNRVRREFVDSETGQLVERDEQVKGYEVENGEYVVLEPEEVASAVPDSDKTLKTEAFVPCNEIDDVYFDKPYYLTPDKMGADAFKLLRDGMRQAKVAALARLFSSAGCARC